MTDFMKMLIDGRAGICLIDGDEDDRCFDSDNLLALSNIIENMVQAGEIELYDYYAFESVYDYLVRQIKVGWTCLCRSQLYETPAPRICECKLAYFKTGGGRNQIIFNIAEVVSETVDEHNMSSSEFESIF